MSTATLPPWLSPWSTGLVYGQRIFKAGEHIRPLDRSRHRPRLTIYTYGHGNNAPILRFSSWSEDGSGAGVGQVIEGSEDEVGESRGLENRGRGSAAPPAVRWERVPLDREPWHVDVPVPIQPRILDRPHPYDVTIHSDVDYEPPSPGNEALHAWSGVLRGWAAGATLLALLVVIVRVGERFLDWKILLRRRRLHREWQRANVRATSRLENLHPLSDLSDECSSELPPPYSACAAPKDDRCEEPPPPYSACVQLVNKNGPVIMYSREAQRRVDRILREMNGTDSTSISPERPGFEENADEHARLTFEIDRILRVCVNRNEAPPTATERLSIYEQLCRRWPRDNDPLRQNVEPLPNQQSAIEAVEAMNTANVDATPLPTEEATAPNDPTDDIDAIDTDDAPNTNTDPDSVVATAYTGADPLGVNDVPQDGSVVV